MATSKIRVVGEDGTAKAFGSIKARAKAASSDINRMLGGALAAAGAYLGFKSIASGINELGSLSDTAFKCSASVDELTQAATAFNILGIQNMGVDQFAKSLQMMEKQTGRTGLGGFKQTIAEIGKIPDAAERAKAACDVFGRSGMEFMPLINAANEGTDAFDGVAKAMPRVTQAAADGGDAIADAMTIAGQETKSIWLNAIGAICNWFDGLFVNGIRGAVAEVGNNITYYLRMSAISVIRAWTQVQNFFSELGAFWGGVIGSIMEGDWSGAFDEGLRAMTREEQANQYELEEMDRKNQDRADRWERERAERQAAIDALGKNYGKAVKQSSGRQKEDAESAATKKASKLTASLIMAGSNEANKLQILGPTLQTETKKQTSILEKIAANTEKSANTEGATVKVVEGN